jgi:hypothetical protein
MAPSSKGALMAVVLCQHSCVPHVANSGGPMSRTRRERICTTLLGETDRVIRCARIVRVGLTFPDVDPVEHLFGLLQEEGYASPEDLRDELSIPDHRLIARANPEPAGMVDARDGARRDVLWNALVLGLCTTQIYDPARPVLWTTASLTRRLELFDPAGFYA